MQQPACGSCRKVLAGTVVAVCGTCELITYCGDECAQYDWVIHEKEHTPPDQSTADLVLPPRVWIGGAEALADLDAMKIDAVVTAVHVDRLSECIIQKHVGPNRAHLRISLHDDPGAPIELYFEQVADFIDAHVRAGHNVLIHCYAGISRSVTLVIAYMLLKLGYRTVAQALDKIRQARPEAGPNSGFMAKLKRLENKKNNQ